VSNSPWLDLACLVKEVSFMHHGLVDDMSHNTQPEAKGVKQM
jgi:hypothetical protein